MLKLAALDGEDLKVLAAHMQDALVQVSDISFQRDRHRLLIEANRFAWESGRRVFFKRRYERRRSILHFDGVTAVRSSGIRQDQPEEVLVLLTIEFRPGEPPGGTIELTFAGEASMQLDVEVVEARLSDLGSAWEAGLRPVHS